MNIFNFENLYVCHLVKRKISFNTSVYKYIFCYIQNYTSFKTFKASVCMYVCVLGFVVFLHPMRLAIATLRSVIFDFAGIMTGEYVYVWSKGRNKNTQSSTNILLHTKNQTTFKFLVLVDI